MPVTVAPVDAQRPGEERGGDHPRPVMHEPFCRELPQAGVDDRDPGASRAPGVQRVRILGPLAWVGGRWPVIDGGDVRERGGDLVEEVTPGQLPAVLATIWPKQRGPRERER